MFGRAARGKPVSRIPRSARRATVGPAPWFVPIAATSSPASRWAAASAPIPPVTSASSSKVRSATIGSDGHGAHGLDRDDELVEVEERLDHEEVDAPSFEDPGLRGVERPVLGCVEDLELPERTDRAGDEDVPPGDLACLPCQPHAGGVDLLERVVEQDARELAASSRRRCSSRSARRPRRCSPCGRRRRSRAPGGSPPRDSAGRQRHQRAAPPCRRPRRSGDRSGGARGTGSRLATRCAPDESTWRSGAAARPRFYHEWLPRKREPAPPRAKRVRWPVRTIGGGRPRSHHPKGGRARVLLRSDTGD